MDQNKSAIGGQGQYGKASFSNRGVDIHSNEQVQQAKDVLTIIRGQDGKPQIWGTGDQTQAQKLFRDAGQTLGVKELQNT